MKENSKYKDNKIKSLLENVEDGIQGKIFKKLDEETITRLLCYKNGLVWG